MEEETEKKEERGSQRRGREKEWWSRSVTEREGKRERN